jgi:hypothetical protein
MSEKQTKRTFIVYNAEEFDNSGKLVPLRGDKGTVRKVTGRYPINAANKVAAMGLSDIIIRQTRIRNKVRRYKGSIEEVTLEEKNIPVWAMGAATLDGNGNKVYKAKKGVADYVGLVKLPKGTLLDATEDEE